MDIKNESYWAIGESIKSKYGRIQKLKDEIEIINQELSITNTVFHKHRVELYDSVSKLNEIAAKQYQIRILEEDIFQCEAQRNYILNNTNIYKLCLSINTFLGNIEFFLTTKGKGPETLFKFNGEKIIRAYPEYNIDESSWVKHGNKGIQKSVIKIFDKKYILHTNGDFVVVSHTCNDDFYKPEDVIGNVLNYELIPPR